MSRFMIVLLIMILFACGVVRGEELVDRNVLINEYGLEDSELLDTFILEHQMTEAYLKEINITYLFELYKNNIENAANSFDYMFEETENNEQKEFLPDLITRIAFFDNPNNEVKALLFDLAAEKIYFGNTFIYHDIREAESVPLRNEKVQVLVDALSKTSDWKAVYSSPAPAGTEESAEAIQRTGWHSWALSIEFTDGSIRQFFGSGPNDDHFPENYAELKESLWAIAGK